MSNQSYDAVVGVLNSYEWKPAVQISDELQQCGIKNVQQTIDSLVEMGKITEQRMPINYISLSGQRHCLKVKAHYRLAPKQV